MKKVLTLILTFITLNVVSQKNLTEKAQPIVAEGKLLYKSEMDSWYGNVYFTRNLKIQK